MPGHLFVTHGDVTTLACDAWLVPTDARRVLEHPWKDVLPEQLPPRPPDWTDTGRRAQLGVSRTNDAPAAWLVNVGAEPGPPVEWYLEGVRQFVDGAAKDLEGREPLHGRAVPLLALPLVGTRTGGVTHIKGDMVAALVNATQQLARAHQVDIVLVLWTTAAHAATQAVRRSALEARSDGAIARAVGLPRQLVAEARRLASLAGAGRLVLFVGAGVSAGAGLPLWNAMLRNVAIETGLSPDDLPAFERLDPLDRGRVLEVRLERQGESLGQRVAEMFANGRPSLAHTLLASLPVDEIATTNYDELFEHAADGAKRPVAVLPYESARQRPRWLLKMHGTISRPDDIVLTRDDYLRYGERRAALAGIVQALLVTRHILFVGFSLNDDNFHRLVHDVRKAMGKGATTREGEGGSGERQEGRHATEQDEATEFGTALLLGEQTFLSELWHGDVRTLAMLRAVDSDRRRREAARLLDIFLDLMNMLSTSSAAHLLDPTFDGVLTDDERTIRGALEALLEGIPQSARRTAAWARIEDLIRTMGGEKEQS